MLGTQTVRAEVLAPTAAEARGAESGASRQSPTPSQAATEGQSSSVATDPSVARVAAQALFERGRALFVEGKLAEACPMFEESHRLVPGIGVLLHLGACLEKSGKPSGAWAAFQEAADRARADGDHAREKVAAGRAKELKGKLSYLTLLVHATAPNQGSSNDPRDSRNGEVTPVRGAAADLTRQGAQAPVPEGLRIERDGHQQPAATVGLELPVDPGAHHLVVHADGMQDEVRAITLAVGDHRTIDVELMPQRGPDPAGTAVQDGAVTSGAATNGATKAGRAVTSSHATNGATTTGSAVTSSPVTNGATTTSNADPSSHATNLAHSAATVATPHQPKASSEARGSALTANARRVPPDKAWSWAPWASVGIGAAGILVGAAGGLMAYTRMHDARVLCEGHASNDCPSESTRLQDQARVPGVVSTVGFAIGAAGLLGAASYWLLFDSDTATVTAAIGPTWTGVAAKTRW